MTYDVTPEGAARRETLLRQVDDHRVTVLKAHAALENAVGRYESLALTARSLGVPRWQMDQAADNVSFPEPAEGLAERVREVIARVYDDGQA